LGIGGAQCYIRLHSERFDAGCGRSSYPWGASKPMKSWMHPSMTIEANLEKNAVIARSTGELPPITRPAGDGTYEVVVPLNGRITPLVLPYSFPSEDEATLWIKSRKGSKRIERARTLPESE